MDAVLNDDNGVWLDISFPVWTRFSELQLIVTGCLHNNGSGCTGHQVWLVYRDILIRVDIRLVGTLVRWFFCGSFAHHAISCPTVSAVRHSCVAESSSCSDKCVAYRSADHRQSKKVTS